MTLGTNHTIAGNLLLPGQNKYWKTRSNVSTTQQDSSTLLDEEPKSIFGIRKLARSYFLNQEKESKIKKLSLDATSGVFPKRETHKNKRGVIGSDEDTEPNDCKDGLFRFNDTSQIRSGNLSFEKTVSSQFHRFEQGIRNSNSANAFASDCREVKKDNGRKSKTFKIQTFVVIPDIPPDTGVESILSQIFGGPLKNLILYNFETSKSSLRQAQLEFVNKEDASCFMNYSKTDLFRVNGRRFIPEWRQEVSRIHQPDSSGGSTIREKLKKSRYLILKQIPIKKRLLTLTMESESPLAEFNLSEIEEDFSKYGKLQNITPVISRKLCVSVSYLNLESAKRAMECFENPDSSLNQKYSKSWCIWFGKDISDQPCGTL